MALASTASAANGWYMSLGAGWNWLNDTDYTVGPTNNTYAGQAEFETGYIIAGAVGYDWGRWRAEFEVAYRDNNINCITSSTGTGTCTAPGSNNGIWEFSQMVNVLYDIPLGGRFSASVGAGVGGVLVVADQAMIGGTGNNPDLDDYVVAGQLIAQVGYDLSDRWQLYADYRYLLADDPEGFSPQNGSAVTWEKSDHSVLIGMRFDLQADRAPMPPKPQQPVQPKAPKQFIVFFGFNKSNLTEEAARVVADAAAAAKEYGSASIMVVGHTDTVGSNSYNNALSMRRSMTVKEALVGHGIPGSAVSTGGRGESELMVQTGDSVKEPQNRRATIDLN
jgi:outer membrane protein OmpA-like peptidoglycan-associated protein